MLNDGGMNELLLEDPARPGHKYKDENGNYKLDKAAADRFYNDSILPYVEENSGMSKDDAIKEYCISSVFTAYFKTTANGQLDITKTSASNFETIVKYWQTASTVLDQFTAEAKQLLQGQHEGRAEHQRYYHSQSDQLQRQVSR